MKERILRTIIAIIGRLENARKLQLKHTFGLKKYSAIGGKNWRKSKYVYAISNLHASLYQIRECAHKTLSNITSVSAIAVSLEIHNCSITLGDVVDASF